MQNVSDAEDITSQLTMIGFLVIAQTSTGASRNKIRRYLQCVVITQLTKTHEGKNSNNAVLKVKESNRKVQSRKENNK